MEARECSFCKRQYPIDHFSRNKGKKTGRRNYCRACAVAYNRKYVAAHRNQYNSYFRAYYLSEKRQAWLDEFLRSPEGRAQRAAAEHRRRARKRGELGVSTEQIAAVLSVSSCYLCGRKFTAKNPATLDHIIPLAQGGKHEVSNLAAAHMLCNCRKHKRALNPYTGQGILI